MSHITMHKPKRLASGALGRDVQIEALAPYPERLDTSFWRAERRGFAHAVRPRMTGLRLGAEEPERAMLRERSDIQRLVSEKFEYKLEELLVSPVLPSEVTNAIREQVAIIDPNAPTEGLLGQYKPAGYQITSTAMIPVNEEVDGSVLKQYEGEALHAPLTIREIAWNRGENTAAYNWTAIAGVEGYGIVDWYQHGFITYGVGKLGGTKRGIDQWVLWGTVKPYITVYPATTPTTFTWVEAAFVTVIAEPLIRIG